ncbi:MAG: ABC transporter permease [Gemmatimonadales bacterium]
MSDEIRRGVRRLFRLDVPADPADEATRELESMIDEEVRHLQNRGLSAEEARQAALARLGPAPARAVADVRGGRARRERQRRWHDRLHDFGADVRQAARSLIRTPVTTAAAVITLALAIGANTSVFSAVNAVLLDPLPVADAGRLVALWEENPDFGWYQQDAAPANVLDWKDETAAFADVAAYPSFPQSATWQSPAGPVLLSFRATTGNLFDLLGVRAALGRVFRDEETWAPAGRGIGLLTDRGWRERFGADPAIVGRSVTLDGVPVRIVGVLPRSFVLPGLDPDLWRPVAMQPENRTQVSFRRAHFVRVIARLKPGVTLAEADAQFQVVVKRLQRDYPETNRHMGAGMTPLKEFLVGGTRLPLLVLLGAVGVFLLIACANVANLLLIRAAGRQRETAVRLALGAGRGRLFRQSLTESLLLGGAAGLVGLGLGALGIRVLRALEPGFLPTNDFRISWPVVAYAAVAALAAAAAFGTLPLLWQQARSPGDALRTESRATSETRASRRTGEWLLVGQVALVLALTLGAGLLVRSYLLLVGVDPGFDGRGVLVTNIALPGTRYDNSAKVVAFFDRLGEEVGALPGVTAVASGSKVPLGPPAWTSEFAIAGAAELPPGTEIIHREVRGDYLGALRVPLVAGRMIAATDGPDDPGVIVVNQAFVRAFFPGEDPIGRAVTFDRVPDSASYWRTIVGVIGDERQNGLATASRPEAYSPVTQEPRRQMFFLARATGSLAPLEASVRAAVQRIDPELAITSLTTMDDVRAGALGRERFLTALLGALAAVGLCLGLVGIYGLVAQVTRRRQREIGIRLALGAGRGLVQRMVIGHGLRLAGAGVAIGGVVAVAGTRLLRTLLYGIAPLDPVTFIAAPVLMLAIGALAAWLPAWRAGRLDPTEVLRAD